MKLLEIPPIVIFPGQTFRLASADNMSEEKTLQGT